MKKSFLLGAAFAMMLGLASCGKTPAGPSGPSADIPVAEGKYTFYFELGAESVECPSYAGYFITGTFSGWATATAPELKNLEGTKIYYAQVELPETYQDGTETKPFSFDDQKCLEYKITMGYNADSGAPNVGISWSFESDVDKSFEYGQNPKFTVDGQKLGCGTHSWEAAPGPVIKINNITVTVTLKEAAPAWVKFTFPGEWNGWDATDEMEIDSTRKVLSYTIDYEMIAGNPVKGKLLMNYTTGAESWVNNIIGSNKTVEEDKDQNYWFSFNKLHETNGYDFNAEDLTLDGDPLEVEYLPDPTALVAIKLKVVLVSDAVINQDLEVAHENIGWGGTAMTTADHITFTFEVEKTVDNPYMSNTGYNFAIKGASSGANWATKLQSDETFKTLGGDTLVTITLKEGGAAYWNAETPSGDGISSDLYTVAVTALAA